MKSVFLLSSAILLASIPAIAASAVNYDDARQLFSGAHAPSDQELKLGSAWSCVSYFPDGSTRDLGPALGFSRNADGTLSKTISNGIGDLTGWTLDSKTSLSWITYGGGFYIKAAETGELVVELGVDGAIVGQQYVSGKPAFSDPDQTATGYVVCQLVPESVAANYDNAREVFSQAHAPAFEELKPGSTWNCTVNTRYEMPKPRTAPFNFSKNADGAIINTSATGLGGPDQYNPKATPWTLDSKKGLYFLVPEVLMGTYLRVTQTGALVVEITMPDTFIPGGKPGVTDITYEPAISDPANGGAWFYWVCQLATP